jgi:UDP-N-acetylglucosamine transferase subunit ALG13
MIFASIGSVLPFDRLIRAVDDWARDNPGVPVLCQIGDGEYEPRFADWVRQLSAGDYRTHLRHCSVFVAHVGMGSILQALEMGRPMVLMPRSARLREVTTDHQAQTAERLKDRPGLTFVADGHALRRELSCILRQGARVQALLGPDASGSLVSRLHDYIISDRHPGCGSVIGKARTQVAGR